MKKICLVFLTAGFAILSAPVQAASDAQAPAVKLDLREVIKKSLKTRRVGYARPVNGSATVTATLKADIVTVSFGLVGKGPDAGSAIEDLSKQKDNLVKSAKNLGFEIISAATTSLNVRARSVRGYASDGSRTSKNVFHGSLAVLLKFKASDNVLTDVARIADDRVNSVGRMVFSFSREKWQEVISTLKKQALEQARANASEQASLQGREVTTVIRSNVRPPRRPRGNPQQMIDIHVTASASFNTQ